MPSTAEQGEQTKLYVLGASAIVGGVTLGWAASQGWVEEEKAFQYEPTIPEEVGTWVAFNVGLVLMGSAYLEAIEEYGFAKVAGVSLGIPAVVLAIRALRS